MSERGDALRAELVAYARELHKADGRAHPDAWRCPHCRRADTLNIGLIETELLRRARALAEVLAEEARP